MSQHLTPVEDRPLDIVPLLSSSSSSTSSLKRRASSSFDCESDNVRKRLKEDDECTQQNTETSDVVLSGTTENGTKLVDEMLDELQCGCCSELVYKPVLVIPCQHFFCGSCCLLWIRNGGTTCPVCRSVATVGMPFRAIQPLIDTILRTAPHRTRAEREKQQADEVYRLGQTIRFPPPREASPPPEMERSADYTHPCPHCLANNPYDWRCPQPLPDPASDPDNAWHADDGVPPGHAHCGNCESLMATRAPSSSRCDFCHISFCGIGVQDRCVALPLLSQHPHNLSTHSDLILSSEVYECFDGNTVEVEIMLEYVDTQKLTPRHIYRDIIMNIQNSPRGFRSLIDLDLFSDLHAVAPARSDQPPEGAQNRVCRLCAAEIFLWGLKDWWIRERKKGTMDEKVMARKDCPDGRMCNKQSDHGHAREFNHVFPSAASSMLAEANEDVQPPQASTSQVPLPSLPSSPPSAPLSPPRLAPSSSAASLSFLLNSDDIGGQSSPIHRPAVLDESDLSEGMP